MGLRSAATIILAMASGGCEPPPTPVGTTIRKVMVVGLEPPTDDTALRIGMKTLPAMAGYTVDVPNCPEWMTRVRIGQRFRVRFDVLRSDEGAIIERPSAKDVEERLCGVLRHPDDRWMDGLPPNKWDAEGELP